MASGFTSKASCYTHTVVPARGLAGAETTVKVTGPLKVTSRNGGNAQQRLRLQRAVRRVRAWKTSWLLFSKLSASLGMRDAKEAHRSDFMLCRQYPLSLEDAYRPTSESLPHNSCRGTVSFAWM